MPHLVRGRVRLTDFALLQVYNDAYTAEKESWLVAKKEFEEAQESKSLSRKEVEVEA